MSRPASRRTANTTALFAGAPQQLPRAPRAGRLSLWSIHQ
jgi:hypothetical protein